MLHEQRFFFLASKAIAFALSRVYGRSPFTGYLTNFINPTPTAVQLTTARNHRGGLTGHLVAWHRAEYLSCATATRSRFYLSTPAWW